MLNSNYFNNGLSLVTQAYAADGNQYAGLSFNDTGNTMYSKIAIGTGSHSASPMNITLNSPLSTDKITFYTPTQSRNVYSTFAAITVSRVFRNKSAQTITLSQVGLTRTLAGSNYVVFAYDVLDPPVTFNAATNKTINFIFTFSQSFGMGLSCVFGHNLNIGTNISFLDLTGTPMTPNAARGNITSSQGLYDRGIVLGNGTTQQTTSSYKLASVLTDASLYIGSQSISNQIILSGITSSVIYSRSFYSISDTPITVSQVGLYSHRLGTENYRWMIYRTVLDTPIILNKYDDALVAITYSVY